MEKITDMVNTIEMFAGLPDIKIEGIDTIGVRYKTIVDGAKKKNYDILDHRKGEVCELWNFIFNLPVQRKVAKKYI